MRLRRPTVRNPADSWSRRLAVFSGKRLDWIVHTPTHLKVLAEAGFLTRSKRGTWAYYALVPGSLDSVAGVLATV